MISKAERREYTQSNRMMLDDVYVYHGKYRAPKNDLKNSQMITDESIISVTPDYLFSKNSYFDKATLEKRKVFSEEISSVQVNDRKEVFILDKNRKLLTKYNNIKDIK
ncbi:hypothetical protein [Psychrobacillus soli]|uniref:Uncharacterized protein n=1 Tax=Psychrobacillus soli TaxID=1543965 RepID=A0A544SP65_9BACI|nr:hypothetical protein [Psychrobacillus soli]TQR06971.1 hypothetical protein FG383_18490 [Psychrobacillus soli]